MIEEERNILHRKLHYDLDTGCRIVEFNPADENHLRHLARYIFSAQFCDGKRVIDMASGTGYGAQEILVHSKPEIFVISDISLNALEYAKKHYSDKLLKVCADAISLPFKDGAFDVFLSFETIEHIPEYRNYLSEIVRVLDEDGIAIISTPNKIYRSPYTRKPRNPFHFIEWRRKEFIDLIKGYFKRIEIYGQYVPRYPISLMVFAPLFDTTLYNLPLVGKIMRKVAGLIRMIFGRSKYSENDTCDYLKKHAVRTISENDEPEIFVVVCHKKG